MDFHIKDEYSLLETQFQSVFAEIVSMYDLHRNTFTYERNVSSKGKLSSCAIFINEMSYPPKYSDTVAQSYMVVRHEPLKNGLLRFWIRHDQYSSVAFPESAILSDKADKNYKYVLFSPNDPALIEYIRQNILYCLINYKSTHVFGCCSSFEACSDAKKCLHSNFLYAKGCQYRKNLEAGRIFYGRNANLGGNNRV